MDDDSDDRLVSCQQGVRDALAATLDTCRTGLAGKYRISEDEVQDAVGWAAINIAIDNYMKGDDFSNEQREEMQIHINYLIHGAVAFSRYFSEDE